MQQLLSLLAEPNQPDRLYAALREVLAETVGYKLLTFLCVDGLTMRRVYSTLPETYPVSASKRMGPTAWGEKVLQNKEPFLGTDMDAMSWAFFDHELIASLGLGSAITVPVVYNGEALGSMNLLHEEHFYQPRHLELALPFAQFLIPAFLGHQR
ncbi:GAF domain-containing protein [Rhizobium sp. BK376]|uniref:GAF domain-containing protein n=1 Tax=Rhizobium sp. BK376 TaxID=2512149 RepID=UPI001051E304|nr:GAF domain-containing protein [Rhizobium sp. BK376]TCR75596.1 GAF domain-containing protein [Rhizobium sp. BK376]